MKLLYTVHYLINNNSKNIAETYVRLISDTLLLRMYKNTVTTKLLPSFDFSKIFFFDISILSK